MDLTLITPRNFLFFLLFLITSSFLFLNVGFPHCFTTPVLKLSEKTILPLEHVLILAKSRTGSSILGSLIAKSPKVFYTFEPLSVTKKISQFPKETTNWIRAFVKDIFLCKAKGTNYEQYHSQKAKLDWHLLAGVNKDLCEHLLPAPNACSVYGLEVTEETLCLAARTHLVKAINLDGDSAAALLQDFSLNLGVIHLVRDPRGVLASRDVMNLYDDFHFDTNAPHYCRPVEHEIFTFEKIQMKRYLLIRYEDLALNPIQEVKRIYKFLRLPYTAKTETMVVKHTMRLAPDPIFDLYGTVRDAKTRPFLWRHQFPYGRVADIQRHCAGLIRKLGYRVFNSEDQYRNLSLPVLVN